MKTIAIVPARSGSKGIKDKNLVSVGGRTLIEWAVYQARNAKLDIFVSTDSAKYKERVDLWYPGMNYCPELRPKKLARDDTPTSAVILYTLDWLDEHVKEKYDTFILLEPTAPLRETKDILIPLAEMRANESIGAVVSVCDSHRMHPALSFRMNSRKFLQPNTDTPHLRRQVLDPHYHLTGTIYAARIPYYRQHQTFITDKTMGYVVERYKDNEIDEPDDVEIVKAFIKRVS